MKKRKRHLNSLQACRKYLNSLINRVESIDDLEEKTKEAVLACKLTFVTNHIGNLLKDSALEERLQAIEEKLEEIDEFKNEGRGN